MSSQTNFREPDNKNRSYPHARAAETYAVYANEKDPLRRYDLRHNGGPTMLKK